MPRQNLAEVTNTVLGMLPSDGSKVLFEDFRQKILTSGIENGLDALGVISKRNLAKLEVLPRSGLQVDERGKVKPGQDRPHVLLYISRL